MLIVGFQCESWDPSVDVNILMNPVIPVWILVLQCGSLDCSGDLEISVWILEIQYGFWNPNVDASNPV